MIRTPISEEANDDDHETSDQVTTEPRRSSRVWSTPEWYGNPILEVMLLDHDDYELWGSDDEPRFHEMAWGQKSEMGSMYENKV